MYERTSQDRGDGRKRRPAADPSKVFCREIAGGSRSVGGDLGSRLPIDRGGDAIALHHAATHHVHGPGPNCLLDQRDMGVAAFTASW